MKTHPMKIFCSVVLSAVLSVLLSACAGSRPAKLYLLEPAVDPQQVRTPTEVQDIGIAVVKVPGYADQRVIASRVDRTRIEVHDDHQWAEEPDAAITRVLANRMRTYTGGNVVVEPWPRGFEPEARVEFDFEKLLRDENGGAEVSGQLRIISGDGREVIGIRSFQVLHDAGGDSFDDFFKALSLAISDIARLAVYSLRSGETQNNQAQNNRTPAT